MHSVLLLLFSLMSSGKAATNLQSVCFPVHCHAALHRSDRAHLCRDSCLYHSRRHPSFSIRKAPIFRLNYQRLAFEMRVEVVELRVLLGRRERHHRSLHNLLPGVVGYLLPSHYPLVNLHSDWSCSCHWCSRCYMTWYVIGCTIKIRSMPEHCRKPLIRDDFW